GRTDLHSGDSLDQMGLAGSHHAYGSGWANLGNTPLNMYKHFCHEGGITSPLIVHWPAGLQNLQAWVHDPAHLMDIMPTVLDAADANYPDSYHGQTVTPAEGTSLLPAITGQPIPERPLAFEHQAARGLRLGKWKITWGKRQPTEPAWELYDLDSDRFEQRNLAEQHPDVLARLAGEWELWARRVGAEPFQEPTDAASN
ncbi:MAG: sulfatase-like hydrolase/transferase, partial [Planctomycetales bacterium]|nr:sulfatase-like hydrolase/transferase [Planctomycetales bacterium]